MKTIPLNAMVKCTDGPAGRSSAVIIDPIQQRVTHIVVKDDQHPWSKDRLVPVERIKETEPKLIRLDCSRSELAQMEPFRVSHYVEKEARDYPGALYAGEGPVYLKALLFNVTRVQVERVPLGEMAVHRGDSVEATDGRVGQVDEFLVDPSSQQITHLVLRGGSLWEHQERAVPISMIERVIEATVYLNINKQTVHSLPTLPAERDFKWEEPEKS